MKRLQRGTVLLSLVEALQREGSWCGGTHVQKATFFLQHLLKVPLGFSFTLYKHGPYSFDLTDELTALRADLVLDLRIRDPRYGPCYAPGELRDTVLQRFAATAKHYRSQVDFVAQKLGDKGVVDLEQVATALYVRLKQGADAPVKDTAERIHRLKPHISKTEARRAVEEVDSICAEAAAVAVAR